MDTWCDHMASASAPLRLGTKTRWGVIEAVLFLSGERYYMMRKRGKILSVALMPACIAETAS